MSNQLFVINPQDAYAGTEGLALGTFAANPEKPSVAHVVQGQVAVWANGQHAQHWSLQPATSAQIAAYDRAPRVAVPAQAAVTQPVAPPAATVPAAAAALLSTSTPAVRGNGWDAIVAMAMQSGLMTPADLQAALPLLAAGEHPSVSAGAKTPVVIDTAAIYAARRNPQQPNAEETWNNALAKVETSWPQSRNAPAQRATLDPAAIYAAHNNRGRETLDAQTIYARRQANEPQQATLDPATIYSRRREQENDAAALWNRTIANMTNPQRN